MSLMKIEDLTYRYESSNKNVLNKMTAEFDKGKVYAIVGKSGSGKTTLLSLISGLDVCTGGSISYSGKNLKETDRDEYRAKSIGVVFQSYNLLLNATAAENIVLSMNISGSDEPYKKEYAYALLERMGIDRETADRKILKLSGGEQQRVGIARALAHNPDIIIADEPTGNLDSETEADIMDILSKLAHDDEKCVIIVTHSKKVSSYADDIYGIADGKLVPVRIGSARRDQKKDDKQISSKNKSPTLDEETFLQLKAIYSAQKNNSAIAVWVPLIIWAACLITAFLLSTFIGGFIGNMAAAVIAVLSAPAAFIPMRKFASGCQSALSAKLDECAKKFETTTTQLRQAYFDYNSETKKRTEQTE